MYLQDGTFIPCRLFAFSIGLLNVSYLGHKSREVGVVIVVLMRLLPEFPFPLSPLRIAKAATYPSERVSKVSL